MTCLVSAYHSSPFRTRASIARYGLLPNRPAKNRPYGVYVWRESGIDHWTFRRFTLSCRWDAGKDVDLYQVGYFGPITPDMYVENGWILHDSPQLVTLITGNK